MRGKISLCYPGDIKLIDRVVAVYVFNPTLFKKRMNLIRGPDCLVRAELDIRQHWEKAVPIGKPIAFATI